MIAGHVRTTGLVCPVGLTAPTACAAIRCELNLIEELELDDEYGEPYLASVMRHFNAGVRARERVLALLSRVLNQAVANVRYDGPVALFVALPAILSDVDVWAGSSSPLAHFASPLSFERSRVLFGGPVTAFEALAEAQAMLATGRVAACIVAAADSLVTPRRILELERAGRLLRPNNPDGVIPGEAAACLLIDRFPDRALSSLSAPGFGHEPATLWNDVVHRADGLVQAASQALAARGYALADMDARITDAAGESFDFREHALLMSRLLERRKESLPLLLPGSVLGDVGVAGPLCGVVKAVATYQRQYAAGPRTLVFARDHLGPRGAVIVEAPGGQS
jgi:3-oxoacyl-[acyl-carrier-protein] synthase-1